MSVMTFRLMLKELSNPMGLCLLLLLLAVILSRRPKACRLLCVSVGLLLLILSTPKVSESLMASVEWHYGEPRLTYIPKEPAIIILGGGLVRLPGGRHRDIEFTD